MRKQTVRMLSIALTAVLFACAIAGTAWGKTIQERFEDTISRMRAQAGSSSGGTAGLAQSESTTQAAAPSDSELAKRLRDLFNRMRSTDNPEVRDEILNIIRAFGIDVDLENITDTDIGKIIEGFGDNSALSQLIALGQEAFSSGTGMLRDVFGDRLGTSFGGNTLDNTTKAPTTSNRPSPTLPVIETRPVTETVVASTRPAAQAAPATQQQQQVTAVVANTAAPSTPAAPTTQQGAGAYNGAAEPIVADSAQQGTQPNAPAKKMDQSSMVVLLILSVATVAVIVAVVIFVIVKKRR